MRRGFTLLEVMVAMAILALGLTTILSSQTGLFSTTRRVQFETQAASLVRCKMSEIELELLQNGYSLIDQSDAGECCEDEGTDPYRCEWEVQTVILPEPPVFDENADPEEELGDAPGADVEDPLAVGSDLATALPTNEDNLAGVGSMDDLAGSLAPAAGGGIIGMALSMVYPSIKPMLEASIRKVKVRVIWNEGKKERSFDVTQYVTNPLEGSLSPALSEEAEDELGGSDGSTTSSSSTSGASTGTTGPSGLGLPGVGP